MSNRQENYLDALKQELALCDRLLYKLGRALDSSQPSLPGKLTIRAWLTQGANKPEEPVIIVQTKERTKYPQRVEEKYLGMKAISRGPFGRNYHYTKELLGTASELFAYRKRLKEVIRTIEMSARSTLNGNRGKLREAEEKVIRLDKDILKKLTEDGLDDYHNAIGPKIFTD